MKKTLMLWSDVHGGFPSTIKANYSDFSDHANIFRRKNLLQRMIRRIFVKTPWGVKHYLDDWINDIAQYEKIIVPADTLTVSIPRCLRNRGYKGRIIYWYWNPISNPVSPKPDKMNLKECELWSFDEADCEQYGLKYNTQYYFRPDFMENNSVDYDFYFVGQDKGRFEILKNLETNLLSSKFRTLFLIIKDYTSKSDKGYSQGVTYQDNLLNVQKSKCLVEINQCNQTGMTLRALEALFFNKKLLTDNPMIKNSKMYSEENVILLDELEEGRLKEFMDLPVNYSGETKKYYEYSSWLRRFEESE